MYFGKWFNQMRGTLKGIFLQIMGHFSNHFFTSININENAESKSEQVAKMSQCLKS